MVSSLKGNVEITKDVREGRKESPGKGRRWDGGKGPICSVWIMC